MQSFDEKLKALLKTEPSFLDKDGELLEGKLQDSARNADEKLIELLITDEEMKSKFFSEIAGYQVFNGNLFIEYISNKNFLDNSYTKYKNKIGLQINGKFLKENGDVALVRPFKDCVLEGGETKEDNTKKEIFFNEILAQDEIDKLFSPKVLTNFKKYNKTGENKVEGFNRDEEKNIKDNLIIKGNNLLTMHSIKKEFEGKVKLIYIDPPYNTGSDSFGYNDKFNHSTWLTFMKNRLEIGKKLLSENGCIFVQCDDNEQAYLKTLMDELFGRENYLRTISMKKKQSAGVGQDAFILDVVEYNLIYAKNINTFYGKKYYIDTEFDEKQMSNYSSYILKYDGKEKYKEITDAKGNLVTLYKWKVKIDSLKKEDRKMECYVKNFDKHFVTYNPQSSLAKKIIQNIEKGDFIEAVYKPIRGKNQGVETSTYFYNQRILQFLKSIAYIKNNEIIKKELITNFWKDMSRDTIGNEGGVTFNNGKKPEKLLQRIIEMTTDTGDIVLDYHLGSGTTAAVCHKMGRQYIGIEQMDYGENDSVIRLNNVINGDQTGISKSVNREGGGEFIYCELKKYNQEFIEQIETAKNTDELLKIRESMKEKAYFKYNFDMQKFEESIDEFKNEDLEKQKELLVEILNKNQLYVNLSDIDDENFEVSDEDKKLNDLFYENC